MARTRQQHVEDVILEVLSAAPTLTTAEITKRVKARVQPTEEDLVRASARQQESKIDQIIANALNKERRLCRDKLVERVDQGIFRLTETGKIHSDQRRSEAEDFGRIFDDLFPDLNEL